MSRSIKEKKEPGLHREEVFNGISFFADSFLDNVFFLAKIDSCLD
jgi:hypothetical protein